ncbi:MULTISPECIES: TIR domain-containing protein [unclassified Bradyrhizobium]|uniref:TIR domain-containing protein n=1 Tax=unclassified Bradyrhizobium TaxID=2631580 RepID=UPI002916AABC|nr:MULTISPECIES: TIR domain-containing protein [unclassified Bradyrhizobium]
MTSSYDKDALIKLLQDVAEPTNPTFGFGLAAPFGFSLSSPFFAPPPRALAPSPPPASAGSALLGAFGLAPPSPPQNPFAPFLTPDLVTPPAAPPRPLPRLSDLVAPPMAPASPAPTYAPASIKRKGFFSFHYADIIRVNNVRNAWKINAPGREDKRQFFDRSLWESVQRKNPDGLKNLIRGGMAHASVVCVLVGTETWARPWVRYEIARSVIDKKGLLAVHLNGLRHHQRLTADARGENPLDFMAVGSPKQGLHYLYERVWHQVVRNGQLTWDWRWEKYSKYSSPVPLPKYIQANPPRVGHVVPLSEVTAIYDYVAEEGHKNIGAWIDKAALRAGR